MASTTTPNRYAATCVRCNGRVAAGKGLLVRTGGRWAADHVGATRDDGTIVTECPSTLPTAVAAPVTKVTEDGIYRKPDGSIWKVQIAKQGSGNLYAKQLVLTTCRKGSECGHPTIVEDGQHKHGHFDYTPGAIHTLTADMAVTRDEAVKFGQLYGVCIRCGADLTDEDSIKRGMGPICAGYYA